jgi:methyl-accepting chemotaxis protein
MADPASRESIPSPEEQVRRLYEGAETQTANAMEQLVASQGFGELLARMTENLVALSKVGSDLGDLVLRNLRIAGRGDITRLARQLNRTEDKLELLLQRIEELQDELNNERAERATKGASKPGAAPRTS